MKLATTPADAQELPDCAFALEAPTTRRLQIVIHHGGNAELHREYWSGGREPRPRLVLTDATFEGDHAATNWLEFYAPGQLSQDSDLCSLRILWSEHCLRLGTWAHYREQLSRAQGYIDELGWHLDRREAALLQALEALAAPRVTSAC